MRHIGTPLRLSLLAAGGFLLVAVAAWVATRPAAPVRADRPIIAPVAAVKPAATPQPLATVPAHRATRRQAPTTPDAGSLSLRAYLDPETGTWGPAPVGAVPSTAAMAATDESYVVTLPSGAEMLVNSPPDYVVATLDANGQRVIRTVSDPRQVKLEPLPASTPVER